jgi:hypothetical protein
MVRLLCSRVLRVDMLLQMTFRVGMHLLTSSWHGHLPIMVLVDQAEFILLSLLDREVSLFLSALWVESFVVISHLNRGLV